MQDELAPLAEPMHVLKLSGALRSLQCDSPDRLAALEGLSSAVNTDAYQVDPLAISERVISESLK